MFIEGVLRTNSFFMGFFLLLAFAPCRAQDSRRAIRKERIDSGLLIIDASGAQLTPDIAQGRRLELYRRLGPIDGGRNFSISEQERRNNIVVLDGVRRFIWTNWKDRDRAYVILNLHSVDATSTSHIFVEPSESGSWQVIWRIVRDNGDIDDREPSYSVAKETIANTSSEVLVFRSKSGNIVGRL